MTPDIGISPEYREALEREAAAADNGQAREPLPNAVRAIDAPPQEPLGWLVKDLWPAKQIGLFVGDGGAFKSSAALHMAAAIAGGYPVFERYQVAEARPVLIVSAEDELAVVLMRLEAFIAGHGWDRERVLGNIHILADGEPSLGLALWKLHLLAEVERIRPGFIILDPWAELLGGDENSNTDARPAIKYLRRLASVAGAGVAVVHHAGKQGGKDEKRALDRIRGASALPSAARVILFFEWRTDGVFVENLKMSRAERLEPFLIKREIETEADNRAQWRSAKLTLQAALPFAEQWIVDRLRESAGKDVGPTSSDLRQMANGVAGVRNQELDRAMKRLEFARIITSDPGPNRRKFWRLVDPKYAPRQLELVTDGAENGENGHQSAQSAPRDRGRPDASLPTLRENDLRDSEPPNAVGRPKNESAQSAPRDRGGPVSGLPPLKGGADTYRDRDAGHQWPDPWKDRDFTPSDLEAEDDERRGMQEG
jgi:hypothetical protein